MITIQDAIITRKSVRSFTKKRTMSAPGLEPRTSRMQNQCFGTELLSSIFNKKESPDRRIDLTDIAWWDCITDSAEIYQKAFLKKYKSLIHLTCL